MTKKKKTEEHCPRGHCHGYAVALPPHHHDFVDFSISFLRFAFASSENPLVFAIGGAVPSATIVNPF